MAGRLSNHAPVCETTDWLTPPDIIDALGPFDLDPCVSLTMPWSTARTMWTIEDDGMNKRWPEKKFIWMNPPYAREADAWLEKLAEHNNGLCLLFCRTETIAWHSHIWPKARAILFLKGRLYFHYPDGRRAKANAGAGSAIIAYGYKAMKRLKERKDIEGHLVVLDENVSKGKM